MFAQSWKYLTSDYWSQTWWVYLIVAYYRQITYPCLTEATSIHRRSIDFLMIISYMYKLLPLADKLTLKPLFWKKVYESTIYYSRHPQKKNHLGWFWTSAPRVVDRYCNPAFNPKLSTNLIAIVMLNEC